MLSNSVITALRNKGQIKCASNVIQTHLWGFYEMGEVTGNETVFSGQVTVLHPLSFERLKSYQNTSSQKQRNLFSLVHNIL